MSNLSDDLIDLEGWLVGKGYSKKAQIFVRAADRIAELEAALKPIEAQAKRIAELEHQLKVECDTYLWNRKRMSRRIALLEYWMEKLFKYGSSPEAIRNELTMMTEIPDHLIREGEDILHHLEERSDLEKGE
jgi:chromosome segregation ATPase